MCCHTPTADAVPPHRAAEVVSCTPAQSSVFSPPFSPKSAGNAPARLLVRTEWSHPLADGSGGQVAARLAHTKDLCWEEGKAWQTAASKRSPCSICLPHPQCGLCFQAYVGTWEISLAMGEKRKKKKPKQSLCPQNVNEMDLQSHNRGQRDI